MSGNLVGSGIKKGKAESALPVWIMDVGYFQQPQVVLRPTVIASGSSCWSS